MGSSAERAVNAILDTLFPRCETTGANEPSDVLQTFYTAQGSDTKDIAPNILATIRAHLPSDVFSQLNIVLTLLDSRLGSLLLAGRNSFALTFPLPLPFTALPVATREKILLSWSSSNIRLLRKAFVGLKALLLFTLMTMLDHNGTSPILQAMNYCVTDPQRLPKPIPQTELAERAILGALADLSGCDASPEGVATAVTTLEAKGMTPVTPSAETAAAAIPQAVWRVRPAFVVEADAVVVGSGAGGGVAAAQLAAAGLKVLVLEKGPFVPAAEMSGQEGESFLSTMEAGGFLATESGAMSVLAGSTLGGGTRVNWSASFRTPDHVRKEWAERLGLEGFASDKYDASLDAVCVRMGVRTGFRHGGHCSALAAGLQQLGVHCGEVPRNCLDSACSGHCCFGCPRGSKQDTANTFLADACNSGAKIITGAWAERIILQKAAASSAAASGRTKQAVGALVHAGPAGNPICFAVSAPIVISSAGTLHTPALLLRSKVACRGNVGTGLRLHPCTVVVGVFGGDKSCAVPPFLGEKGTCEPGFAGPTPAGNIRCWEGPIMSVYSKAAADWEDSGYGSVMYTPALHPGLFAASAPWLGGRDFKDLLLQFPNAVAVLVLVRDSGGGGRVKVDRTGRPRLHYVISDADKRTMVRGMKLGLRTLAAAGASRVMTLLGDAEGRFPAAGGDEAEAETGNLIAPADPRFEEYLQQVEKEGVPDLRMATFSAHQMGTARMGTDPATSVVDPHGECWEASGLYCCDASVFPTALGINPMVTIEAIAHMVTGGIAERAAQGSLKGGGKAAVQIEYEEA